MNLKIKCKSIDEKEKQNIRVKVLKAPFVNSHILNQVVADRERAIILS